MEKDKLKKKMKKKVRHLKKVRHSIKPKVALLKQKQKQSVNVVVQVDNSRRTKTRGNSSKTEGSVAKREQQPPVPFNQYVPIYQQTRTPVPYSEQPPVAKSIAVQMPSEPVLKEDVNTPAPLREPQPPAKIQSSSEFFDKGQKKMEDWLIRKEPISIARFLREEEPAPQLQEKKEEPKLKEDDDDGLPDVFVMKPKPPPRDIASLTTEPLQNMAEQTQPTGQRYEREEVQIWLNRNKRVNPKQPTKQGYRDIKPDGPVSTKIEKWAKYYGMD